MPYPVPAPVHNFFARFLSKPEERGLRNFCIDLLDIEVSRAEQNVFCDQPLAEASKAYKGHMALAERALSSAIRSRWLCHENLDLPYYWLTLLGHRLAVERGLSVGSIAALVHVASARLDLPLKETKAWYADTLFRQYTETVLRDEWDYPGIQFHMAVNPPPGAA